MRRLVLFMVAATASTCGCSLVTSGQPATGLASGEAWYVRTSYFLGLPVGTSIFHCPADSPTTCREAWMRSGQKARTTYRAKPDAPPPANRASQYAPPPTALAGFAIGSAITDGEQTCSAAKGEWRATDENRFQCNGPLKPAFGTKYSRAELDYCQDELCGIELVAPLDGSSFVAEYEGSRRNLQSAYGDSRSGTKYGIGCRESSRAWIRCLEIGDVEMREQWQWPTKERLRIWVGVQEQSPSLMLQLRSD